MNDVSQAATPASASDRTRLRLDTCGRCPQRLQGFVGDRCNLCGCFLALKARMADQTCPAGYWPC